MNCDETMLEIRVPRNPYGAQRPSLPPSWARPWKCQIINYPSRLRGSDSVASYTENEYEQHIARTWCLDGRPIVVVFVFAVLFCLTLSGGGWVGVEATDVATVQLRVGDSISI